MKCLECRGRMQTRRENVRYDASGLKGITLVGVEVSRCLDCGKAEIAIPRIEQLHRLIAKTLIEKHARLTPAEIVFLRKSLGWSGVDFARHMGTRQETVTRWERGSIRMGATADRLLRMMVASKTPIADYSVDTLGEIADSAPPSVLKLKASADTWQVAA